MSVSDELDFDLDESGFPRRIRSESVDLRFAPERRRTVAVNLLALRTRLRWALGAFEGTIAGHDVRGLRGFAEDHAALW